ncbi:GspE/PulE family protein [Phyllobacterium myrsinacearum]|uniref:General secretion pathway protein E n=1 Tax=Phyllobacterium myrsinacearum TaxID=28101 RepID=A0A839EV98_9HYPH|nr:GspE/PulE family protein [Phyllobacterium myrsinacearum]MBA8882025.1 general secretion pathway protein E [Phyllobacterium myrsinacearum]
MLEKVGTSEQFVQHLAGQGHLTHEAVQRVRTAIASTGHAIDVVIRELGLMPEALFAKELAGFLRADLQVDFTALNNEVLLGRIGQRFAEDKALVPLRLTDEVLELIVANPFDADTMDALSYLFDVPVKLLIAPRSAIEEYLRHLGQEPGPSDVIDLTDDDNKSSDVERLLDIAREAPVVRFVSRIVQRAVDEKTTDIHIEPQEDLIRIRFRRDGLLDAVETAAKSLHAGIASRIKILAKLNIAERRLPQDGRLRFSVRGQEIDFRVSIMPTIHGETIVLRILDRSNVKLNLGSLGYDEKAREKIVEIANRPNGIILITGPTGSGKTTTLYSMLHELNRTDVKIFTVEDPVEYRIKGITQLQVDPAIGLTFASALRSVLRQDPDIILVGEIRDRETAQIAIQAALTGHLVLSTLHTNNAVGAVSRLRDMGIESYLLEATLRGVISQRLLRTSCPACAGRAGNMTCKTCHGSGFNGRQVTYEILEITEVVRQAISNALAQEEIERLARTNGMQLMTDHASSLVKSGKTTAEEVARVVDLEKS